MKNQLRQVVAEIRQLTPAEAEVWIVAEAEQITPTTEVRGRLVGPRLAGASTVEVAYPLRPFPRRLADVPLLTRRVIIPDPSLWEPERPFVYRAFVELWQDGEPCDRAEFDCGLRLAAKE